jgi:hypothetical protein
MPSEYTSTDVQITKLTAPNAIRVQITVKGAALRDLTRIAGSNEGALAILVERIARGLEQDDAGDVRLL